MQVQGSWVPVDEEWMGADYGDEKVAKLEAGRTKIRDATQYVLRKRKNEERKDEHNRGKDMGSLYRWWQLWAGLDLGLEKDHLADRYPMKTIMR